MNPMNYFPSRPRWLIAGMLMTVAGTVSAQDFPSKPVRFIVPYDPGGNTTILARLVGEKLSQGWGQQVLVDNRPGGNTVIGSEAMVRSAPDGYTILLVTSTHVIGPLLNARLPYDSVKDFAAVATLARSDLILAMNPDVPANTLQDLIAAAKARPGELNAAAIGTGGITHLASEYFNIQAGVKTQHVPYKGTGLALTDLVAGQVQLFFAPPAAIIPFIKSGKLKGVAVTTENRMTALPQVPTFAEAGLPGYELKSWYGVLAPAGTVKRNIDRLSADIGKALAAPDIKKSFLAQDMDPFISTPEQFTTMMGAERIKFARIIKTANIKVEN
jgi:tripartite-type tricarboxylate transporter receptor subunit TctC